MPVAIDASRHGLVGDIALSFGAVGGVLLAGGIAPNIVEHLRKSRFRGRFRGRCEGYMRAIATNVIMQPHAALVGAAKQLRRLNGPA